MSADLDLTIEVQGSGTLRKDTDIGNARELLAFGSLPRFPALELTLSYGTGDEQATTWFTATGTLAAAGSQNFELVAGSLTNNLGQSIAWSAVKHLMLVIVDSDGTKQLRIGPQAVANGWQGPFGGVGASNYLDVFDWFILPNRWDGYAAGVGNSVLRLYNPTAADVEYALFAAGK